jgi:hypothetical protein
VAAFSLATRAFAAYEDSGAHAISHGWPLFVLLHSPHGASPRPSTAGIGVTSQTWRTPEGIPWAFADSLGMLTLDTILYWILFL